MTNKVVVNNKSLVQMAPQGAQPGPQVIKPFFMLSSAETVIYHAHKCFNDNNCWHFNINYQDKSHALVI